MVLTSDLTGGVPPTPASPLVTAAESRQATTAPSCREEPSPGSRPGGDRGRSTPENSSRQPMARRGRSILAPRHGVTGVRAVKHRFGSTNAT